MPCHMVAGVNCTTRFQWSMIQTFQGGTGVGISNFGDWKWFTSFAVVSYFATIALIISPAFSA